MENITYIIPGLDGEQLELSSEGLKDLNSHLEKSTKDSEGFFRKLAEHVLRHTPSRVVNFMHENDSNEVGDE